VRSTYPNPWDMPWKVNMTKSNGKCSKEKESISPIAREAPDEKGSTYPIPMQ
jgi:hypothetical protein